MDILIEEIDNDDTVCTGFSVQRLNGLGWSKWQTTIEEAERIGLSYEDPGGYTTLEEAAEQVAKDSIIIHKVYHDGQTFTYSEFKQQYPEYFI